MLIDTRLLHYSENNWWDIWLRSGDQKHTIILISPYSFQESTHLKPKKYNFDNQFMLAQLNCVGESWRFKNTAGWPSVLLSLNRHSIIFHCITTWLILTVTHVLLITFTHLLLWWDHEKIHSSIFDISWHHRTTRRHEAILVLKSFTVTVHMVKQSRSDPAGEKPPFFIP